MFVVQQIKPYKVNYKEYKDRMIKYQDKLDIFKDLKEGEKIGKDDNTGEYYITPPGYFQQITRWWYEENRDKTIKYMSKEFDDFVGFLDDISMELDNSNTKPLIVYVKMKIFPFINEIILGLYTLKKTYSDYEKMVAKVDSIILTLLDFKEKIDKLV